MTSTVQKSTIKLIGVPQSPYSRKMRAALRYRRIPHQWIRMGSKASHGHPQQKIKGMIPVLWFSNDDNSQDTAMLDSTFQLQHLETLSQERSIMPSDPVVNFFSSLLEDFADEWLTKCMFHYRWHGEQDVKKAQEVIPLEMEWTRSDEEIKPLQAMFGQRQVERLWVVGSNPTTITTIEDSYRHTLTAMNKILSKQSYLLGNRASAADFAFMGQLACLTTFEQSSEAVTLEIAPRVYAWVECVEDLSGEIIEDNSWLDRDSIAETLADLLKVIGNTYIPFLLANAKALSSQSEEVSCEIYGKEWKQKPFPYQGKCLLWLREAFSALSADDQAFVKSILQNNACGELISF